MAEEKNIGTFSTASSSSVVTPSSITSSDGTSVSAADVPPKPPRQDESGGSTVTVTSPVPIIVTLTSVDAPSFTSIVTTPIPMIVTLTSVDAPSFTSIRGNTPSAGLTSIDALSAGLTSIDGNAPVTITSSRVVALTASSTPTKAASVDDDSFFTDKPTVIGICVAAGLVLALLIGFCLFKISQRNKRRMEKEQDMENDEIIVGFAANTLAQREEEKQEKEENDGSGRDPNHFTRRNENYTLPRQRYGYGNGDYPGGPTDFGGVYGYPAPGQYAFNSNTVAAVVGNEQCLPNPYDRNEHQGSSAPHGSDKRMNSRVSLRTFMGETKMRIWVFPLGTMTGMAGIGARKGVIQILIFVMVLGITNTTVSNAHDIEATVLLAGNTVIKDFLDADVNDKHRARVSVNFKPS
ncbi:hypothetical protein K435DRAFT_802161 [Dendrothele bispora CBS 962.96]|uniref:Mid2 domain-containing protein n=1 Tax=Dendrothele bispora (strain CBS 962.96) TaxID=1314807 RepID=A0A4S8LLQ7_DENBC|nr:hypothetical protein K435DRAFT_802161 [Dendrothele bispora CBS 962.96]